MARVSLAEVDELALFASHLCWVGSQAIYGLSTEQPNRERFTSVWKVIPNNFDEVLHLLRHKLSQCSADELNRLRGSLSIVVRALDSIASSWEQLEPGLTEAVGGQDAHRHLESIKEGFQQMLEDVEEALDPNFQQLIREAISSIPKGCLAGHHWRKKIDEI